MASKRRPLLPGGSLSTVKQIFRAEDIYFDITNTCTYKVFAPVEYINKKECVLCGDIDAFT